MSKWLHEYQVVGRRAPTKEHPSPKVFRMRLFAPNEIVAKSRFWYFLSQIYKLKKSSGEILSVNEIFEKRPQIVKTYGVFLKYNSRSGTHNLYKEFRDTTRVGAIGQLYTDMAARHRARWPSINIIDTKQIPVSQVRRTQTKQFLSDSIKFPLPHRVSRPASRKYYRTFVATRPRTNY